MRADSVAAAIVELAIEQNGLVTSRQARAEVGATTHQLKRMADSGQLERLHHGIYRVARSPFDEHQAERVAWIALDPGTVVWERLDHEVPVGVVSHASAARLQNLGDIDADTVELTAVRRIRLSIPDLVVHRGDLTRADWEVIDGMAVTTPARTISDLAESSVDVGHLAAVVRDAVAGDRLSADEVADELAPYAFRYGHRPFNGAGFRDALIELAGIPTSSLAMAKIAANSLRAEQLAGLFPREVQARTADLLRAALTPEAGESTQRMLRELSETPEMQKLLGEAAAQVQATAAEALERSTKAGDPGVDSTDGRRR